MYDIMLHDMIIEFAVDLMSVLLVTAFGVAWAWITAKVFQKKGLDNIAAATNELDGTVKRVVDELQQTTVEKLKAASSDGKLSQSEIEQLGAMLLEKALAQMSEPAMKILHAAGKDIKAMITSAGEAAILAMKKK